MAKAPAAAKKSPAQIKASQGFAAAGQAAQARARSNPRTAAAAHAKSVSAGRKAAATRKRNIAAAAAARGKKTPVVAKKVAAVAPEETAVRLPGFSWLMACNDFAPTCAAAAVANHLLACTGLAMSEDDILQLHTMAGGDNGADIAAVLECMHAHRNCFGAASKAWLATYTRTDEDVIVAGLVVGVRLPHAGHAVLSHPQGMVSWGRVMPFAGVPQEAWALEWVR
jgi:hypothetical protein